MEIGFYCNLKHTKSLPKDFHDLGSVERPCIHVRIGICYWYVTATFLRKNIKYYQHCQYFNCGWMYLCIYAGSRVFGLYIFHLYSLYRYAGVIGGFLGGISSIFTSLIFHQVCPLKAVTLVFENLTLVGNNAMRLLSGYHDNQVKRAPNEAWSKCRRCAPVSSIQ